MEFQKALGIGLLSVPLMSSPSSSAEQRDQHRAAENPTRQELELLELCFIILLKI